MTSSRPPVVPVGPVVVVGAGAAGLVAAIFAARSLPSPSAGSGRSAGGPGVILLESTGDGGRKILISGGGRCNILPARVQPERYVTSSSPNLLRRMLRSWPLPEQRAFFEELLGMRLVLEAETGKLFPESHRARDVRDGLVRAAGDSGAEIRFGTRVVGLRPPEAPEDGWTVEVAGAPALRAAAVVLATGGLSVPATGSDGRGLTMAESLGHTVHPTYPALTPLLADPAVHAHLAGVSLPVTIGAPGARPRFTASGGFLFTHRGYSGPAVLDASHLAVRSGARDGTQGERQELTVRWTHRTFEAWEALLLEARSATTVGSLLARELPTRLAEQLLDEAGVAGETALTRLDREGRRLLARLLSDYPLPWTGDEGYKKAEVTGGGVALEEVDPRTLESRIRPGLFLCGEILDAFGPIGGHNFLWAWATGRAAGRAAGAGPA